MSQRAKQCADDHQFVPLKPDDDKYLILICVKDDCITNAPRNITTDVDSSQTHLERKEKRSTNQIK